MLPALRLKKTRGGISILSLPNLWYAVNAVVGISLVVMGAVDSLAWWAYLLELVIIIALLYEEKWICKIEQKTITYRRGLRLLSLREDIFHLDEVQGLFLGRVGRYHTLSLIEQSRVWEMERANRLRSVESLARELQKAWSLILLTGGAFDKLHHDIKNKRHGVLD